MDPAADDLAAKTLREYVETSSLFSGNDALLRTLVHPIRLETANDIGVSYSSSIDERARLTMINTIDQLNFETVEAGTTLGWFSPDQPLNHPHTSDTGKLELTAYDSASNDRFDEFFSVEHGQLITNTDLVFFMATTDPRVAETDCLLYFSAVNPSL